MRPQRRSADSGPRPMPMSRPEKGTRPSMITSTKHRDRRRSRHRGRQHRRHRGDRERQRPRRPHRRSRRSRPGSSARARSPTPTALAAALKDLFAREQAAASSPPRRRQPARRRAHAAHAADRGPQGARDRDPLPGRRTSIPMPLEQAVLDCRSSASDVGEDGRADGRRRRRRPPRHGRARSSTRFARPACKPVGIDLSAFGMIRALAGEIGARTTPRRVATRSACSAAGRRRPGARPRPARLLCNLGDVTNLAVARGSTCLFTRVSLVRRRGHRPAARRAPRADPRARAPVARPRRPRATRRDDRGRPRDRRRGARGARRGRLEARRRAAALARVLRRPGGRAAVEEIVACGPGTTIAGLRRAARARARLSPSASPARRRSPHLDDADRRPADRSPTALALDE